MELQEQIQACYKASKNYPELVRALINTGVLSYTVDTATTSILYRFAGGVTVLHAGEAVRAINETFSGEQTVDAIRTNQQGKSTYPEFMTAIAKAGVRFYEATLEGERKRVDYIGTGGHYEELIPV
jgi:uncharacterized protein YbcV (DUF1398 family)